MAEASAAFTSGAWGAPALPQGWGRHAGARGSWADPAWHSWSQGEVSPHPGETLQCGGCRHVLWQLSSLSGFFLLPCSTPREEEPLRREGGRETIRAVSSRGRALIYQGWNSQAQQLRKGHRPLLQEESSKVTSGGSSPRSPGSGGRQMPRGERCASGELPQRNQPGDQVSPIFSCRTAWQLGRGGGGGGAKS